MNNLITSWIRTLPGAALSLGITMAALQTIAAEPDLIDKREMLSKHQTVAQFEGVNYHCCLGMTSECPDRCGSSGDMASFRILEYLAYEKPGEYGDAKQERYQFLVQDNMGNVKVPADIKTAVASLKQNDYVLLDWQHDYVTRDGSKFPERTVILLKPITREEADKLAGGLDKLPKDEAKKGAAKKGPKPSPR
jgi:hypothetical protein